MRGARPHGRRVRLEAAQKLLNNPDSACAEFLAAQGFDPKEAASNLKSHTPYNVPLSTNCAGDIGALPVNYKNRKSTSCVL